MPLVTEHPIRSSHLGHLDPNAFVALGAPRRGAFRSASRRARDPHDDWRRIARDPARPRFPRPRWWRSALTRRLSRARLRPPDRRPHRGGAEARGVTPRSTQHSRKRIDRDFARPPARCCVGRYCVTVPIPRRSGSCAGTRPSCVTGSIRTPAGACTSTRKSRGCSRFGEPDANGTYPAREPRSQPRSAVAAMCSCARRSSVLERADARITLGRLAEGIIGGDEGQAPRRRGCNFELSGREERRRCRRVVRLLLELGVLARMAGDEDALRSRGRRRPLRRPTARMAVLIAAPAARR